MHVKRMSTVGTVVSTLYLKCLTTQTVSLIKIYTYCWNIFIWLIVNKI